MSPILEASALRLSIATGHVIQKRKTILDDVSFAIQPGKATAYLGPNGAGKTSTFRILCGLTRPDSGTVHFRGQSIPQGLPASAFGFMPEQPYFYRRMSPRELLAGLGRLSGLSHANARKASEERAEQLHFDHVLDQPLAACSKGQVQRVGLAQALMHRPDFILLDEPMSGLDPLGRECVREVIRQEISRGASLLFSSHILADAEAMCEEVIVLDQGRVAYAGDLGSLLAEQHLWTIRFSCTGTPTFPWTEQYLLTQDPGGSWRLSAVEASARNRIIQELMATPDAELLAVEMQKRTLEEAFVGLVNSQETR